MHYPNLGWRRIKPINTATCPQEESLRKLRSRNTMEPRVFKGKPAHVYGESDINPGKLLMKMAEKYGSGNFCIKVDILNQHGSMK
jgi:hypothetical protein